MRIWIVLPAYNEAPNLPAITVDCLGAARLSVVTSTTQSRMLPCNLPLPITLYSLITNELQLLPLWPAMRNG